MATDKAMELTLADCEELYAKFIAYTETAEQHEFAMLALVNMALDVTMLHLREGGGVRDQKEARAMFRVVLQVIGEDFSEYMEIEDGGADNGL